MQGRDLYNSPLINQGESYYLLSVIWQGVIETFAKIVRCTDEETINPVLNPDIFPYPAWVPDTEKLAMEYSLVDDDGELAVVATDEIEDGQKALLDLDLNFTQADLNVNEPDDPSSTSSLTVRLPFQVTVDDVMNPNLFFGSSLVATNLAGINATADTTEKANTNGHLIREAGQGTGASSLDNAPPSCTSSESCKDPEQNLFAGASLNAEELFNSMTYLLFKKGPFSFLDFFKTDDFDPADLEINSDYSIGIDKVVLGRFGICNSIAGGLNTDLPPGILFANIASQFDYPATHWDIELDKNYPPTLAMMPIDDDGISNPKLATDIKIGLTNVRISVKELENGETANEFRIGKEVVQIRVDGVLSLKTVYHTDEAELYVFIEPYDEQNLHWSVVPGKGGSSYDDVDVIYNLATEIVPNLFAKMGKTFSPDLVSADGTDIVPTVSVKFDVDANGYVDVESLADVEVTFNMDEVSNGSCEGVEIPVYVAVSETSGNEPLLSVSTAPALESAVSIRNQETAKKTRPSTSSSRIQRVQQIDLADSNGIMTGLLGTCTENGLNDNMTKQDDPYAEALCDFGIQWIKVKPSIEFDNDNGYLHLSSDLILEVYDWLVTATGT
jgi:hypothetical protein